MNVIVAVLTAYLVVVNVAAFALFGMDKARAKRGAWRVPERTLLIVAFAGGGIGALAGMLVFRHKTRKPKFLICVPLALVLGLVVFGGALYVADYYEADEAAIAASAEGVSDDGVEVRWLAGESVAFVPAVPKAGMVFYPGAKVQPEAYAPLMHRLAEQDILCVLVKPHFNLAILDVSAADGVIDQFPDIDRWLLAGHSMGGVAAAEYLAAHTGEFEGVVFLASYPAADLSLFDGYALSVYGSDDGVLNRASLDVARQKLPADAREHVIEGGNHAYFGNYGEQSGDGAATISRDDQQAQTVREIASAVETAGPVRDGRG